MFLLTITMSVSSHEVRPAYLELNEEAAGVYRVLWKTPMRGELRLALTPEFSEQPIDNTPITFYKTNGAAVQTWRMKFTQPLHGKWLRIVGLEKTMTDVLVHIQFIDGVTWTHRLTPVQPSIQIPLQESALVVAGVYLKLGIEHILAGIDHLLFVFALLLITQGSWKLVKTVTAFTLAHSITLGMATLGLVQVPQSPIEAVIALSIVFLAAEIVRAHQGRKSITYRFPWLIAFVFGLVHGFGFAGALNEIGLPQGQIPLALLFFNLGVELGQLLFIAVMFSLGTILQRIPILLSRRAVLAVPYLIGSVAMFWVIQRVASF